MGGWCRLQERGPPSLHSTAGPEPTPGPGPRAGRTLSLRSGTGDKFLIHSPGKEGPVTPSSPCLSPRLDNGPIGMLPLALAGPPCRPSRLAPCLCPSPRWLLGRPQPPPALPTGWEHPPARIRGRAQGRDGPGACSAAWSHRACLPDGQMAHSKSHTNTLVLVLATLRQTPLTPSGEPSGHLGRTGNGTAPKKPLGRLSPDTPWPATPCRPRTQEALPTEPRARPNPRPNPRRGRP